MANNSSCWYTDPAPGKFLGFDSGYDTADAVVLPVPFEKTVSYGRGTSEGPQALLDASGQVEVFDEEFGCEPVEKYRIHTLPPVPPVDSARAMNDYLHVEAARHLAAGKWLLALGGEHSISPGLIRAHSEKFPNLGVLQFDAHSDMRPAYEGEPFSHASAMARAIEYASVTGVGIRSGAVEEQPYLNKGRHRAFFARTTNLREAIPEILSTLPENVYISFDIDGLDPSIVPGTGTPEPGGLLWWETLALIREVARKRRIVGADIVELAPLAGNHVSEFAAARLAYKILSYAFLRP